MGETVPEVLSTAFNLFDFSLQPICVEEGRVRVDVQSEPSIANQNKTLQHEIELVIYIITIKLSFIIKKGNGL